MIPRLLREGLTGEALREAWLHGNGVGIIEDDQSYIDWLNSRLDACMADDEWLQWWADEHAAPLYFPETDKKLYTRAGRNVTGRQLISDRDALRQCRHLLAHLCRRVAVQWNVPGREWEDLWQEGSIAVLQAARLWDGTNKLTTVAWVYVRNALINYVSRRRPPALVAVENERDGDAWEEPDPLAWREVIDAIRSVPDHHLLMLHAAGYKDRGNC